MLTLRAVHNCIFIVYIRETTYIHMELRGDLAAANSL